jgi:hypothetical protein
VEAVSELWGCTSIPNHAKMLIHKNTKMFHIRQRLQSLLSRILLQKLTLVYVFKKYPDFYGTPSSITMFKTTRHRSLF